MHKAGRKHFASMKFEISRENLCIRHSDVYSAYICMSDHTCIFLLGKLEYTAYTIRAIRAILWHLIGQCEEYLLAIFVMKMHYFGR